MEGDGAVDEEMDVLSQAEASATAATRHSEYCKSFMWLDQCCLTKSKRS